MTAASSPAPPATPAAPAIVSVPPEETPYAVRFADGSLYGRGFGAPRFTLLMRDPQQLLWFLKTSRYQAASAFLDGKYDVEGDLVETVRFKSALSSRTDRWWGWLAHLHPQRWMQTQARAAENIRFHYDRSTAFYKLFLDSSLVYSCAWFRTPQISSKRRSTPNST